MLDGGLEMAEDGKYWEIYVGQHGQSLKAGWEGGSQEGMRQDH